MSNRINEIEKNVGKELFNRKKRGVDLTSAGEALFPYAKGIVQLKKDGIVKARMKNKFKDRLTIGVANSIYKGRTAFKKSV